MALPQRKPERDNEEKAKSTASQRADKRWGLAIRRLLSPLRTLLEKMGVLERLHVGVVDRLYGDEFYEGASEQEKQEMDELGRFVFIGTPDGRGGYVQKLLLHEDAIEGFLAAGFEIIRREEDEMPLNQQDKDWIIAALAQAQASQGFTPAWKQVLVICLFALGCVGWWTVRLDRSEDRADARMAKIEDALEAHGKILERLDERSQRATSVDTRSSTPPTTTDGSPRP